MTPDDDRLRNDELPFSAADHIDQECDRFEAAWKAGQNPTIESFVVGWSGSDRSALLHELVALEIALRRDRGEQASRQEYAERFPQDRIEIDPESTGDVRPEDAGEASPRRPAARPLTEGPGTRVGPYKILQKIGEGGMGVVYMAEQEKPVRRRVALKIIKPGMDTDQVIARFEAERQALAMMDHQNIARVLDAGATDTARPYFVMELVRGVPITECCDRSQLMPKERLELFIPVCQAIQHAHQKGLIHRDIKPSNVLVTLYDGKPVAKVIDFGVAKATDQRLTERTMFTQFGQIIGTLEYMSPEQAEMGALDIDTRSDIYSLGVVLYELLTGSTPLQRARLREAGYAEILRRIREDETPRPSTRLSESKDAMPTISAQRKTEPARLAKLVRGELDWIVMKALEKDRTRRYETANGFARDIQRYLDGDPVEAGPPSAAYWLRKFARKHRGAFMTAGTFSVVLLAATAVSSLLAFRASRAEHAAKKALSQVRDEQQRTQAALGRATEEEQKAVKSAAESRAVLDFFEENVLAATRPEGEEGGLGREVTIRKAVDAAEPKIAEAFREQPRVEASIRRALGETYYHLGEPGLAIAQQQRSLELRRAALGPDHPHTLDSMNSLAVACIRADQLGRAISLLEDVLKTQRAILGENHRDTFTSMNNLAAAFEYAGQLEHAISLHEQVLKAWRAKLGENHSGTLTSMSNLAAAYSGAGENDRAVSLFEKVLKTRRVTQGENHPDTLFTLNNLAVACYRAGQLDRAISLHEQALKARRAILGDDHPETLLEMNNLASAYYTSGQFDRAISLYEQAIEAQRVKPGENHPDTLLSMSNLANAYANTCQIHRAIPLFEKALEAMRVNQGKNHPRTLSVVSNLATTYRYGEQLGRAIALHEQTLKAQKATLGCEHPDTLATRRKLADDLLEAKRLQEAESLYHEVVEATRRRKPRNDRTYADSLAGLGRCLIREGKPGEAMPVLEESKTIKEKMQPADWTTANANSLLGEALVGLKRFPEAEPLLLAGQKGMAERRDKIPVPELDTTLRDSVDRLVRLYEAWNKPAEAEKWRKTLADLLSKESGKSPGPKKQ